MSFQPVIPWRDALQQLQQRPLLLRQPGPSMRYSCLAVILPVQESSTNGEYGLSCLCQPWGQARLVIEYRQFGKYDDTTVSGR